MTRTTWNTRTRMKHLSLLTFFILFSLLKSSCVGAGSTGELIKINDDNWADILDGEWMVEFFAPWCPACRSLQPIWEDFASWSNDLGIKVGQVDITSSPGLSGRFMITALPTIFHVKSGEFRQYKGPRSKDELLGFVEEKRWEQLEPISKWQSPSSLQMGVVSQFYKVSMQLRNVMNVMLEDYGIPTWAAYLMFGVATILIGLILGLLLVCIIDFIYPPGPTPTPRPRPAETGSKKDKDSDDEFTEDIQDESPEEGGSGSGAEDRAENENENDEEDNEDESEKDEEVEEVEEQEGKSSPNANTTRRRRRE